MYPDWDSEIDELSSDQERMSAMMLSPPDMADFRRRNRGYLLDVVGIRRKDVYTQRRTRWRGI